MLFVNFLQEMMILLSFIFLGMAPAKGIRMFFRSVRSNRESGANPEQCSLL